MDKNLKADKKSGQKVRVDESEDSGKFAHSRAPRGTSFPGPIKAVKLGEDYGVTAYPVFSGMKGGGQRRFSVRSPRVLIHVDRGRGLNAGIHR